MLKKVSIANFRNLKNVTIEPALMTLLIGANDSGKSGIFHSLLVLKQTFQTDFRPDGFSFVGRLINLGSRKEVVYDHNENNGINITISWTFDAGVPDGGVSSSKGEFTYNGISKIDGSSSSMNLTIDGLNCEFVSRDRAGKSEVVKVTLNGKDVRFDISNIGNLGFNGQFSVNAELRKYAEFFSSNFVRDVLQNNLFFVPVPRGIGEFKTKLLSMKARELVTSSGTAELTKNLLSAVSYDINLVDKISIFMERMFGKKMRPSVIPSDLGDLTLGIGREESGTFSTVDFYGPKIRSYASNTGFGLNQILFLFAQVLECPNGSTIMIEEPEISLHPLAQKELIEILIEIAKSQNKQFIISTHSEHIAFALYGASDKGILDASGLSVYHFKKQKGSTDAVIEKIDSFEGSLKGFLGDDPKLIYRYIEAFGKHKEWLEKGTIGE